MDQELRDRRWMELAIEVAGSALGHGEGPFGAIIVSRDGDLQAVAKNNEHGTGDATAHAEMEAIREATREAHLDLSGSTIYSTHEPCSMCAAAIGQARLSRVVIGTRRSDLPEFFRQRRISYLDILSDARFPPQVQHGVCLEAAMALFRGENGNGTS